MAEYYFEKAKKSDLNDVLDIYQKTVKTPNASGWIYNKYPVFETANKAYLKDELYVLRVNEKIVACAKINNEQMEAYEKANWKFFAESYDVLVIHTLVVDPNETRKGYATLFMEFYEKLARQQNIKNLRMDTGLQNIPARKLYKKLGFCEVGVVDCEFCGIQNVKLVCLEKHLF